MANVTTWTWKIDALMTVQNVANQLNFVTCALWTLTGTDGTQTASTSGNTYFQSTPENVFVAYNSLTQETVIGWVQSSLGSQGIANYEALVQQQINQSENPPIIPIVQALPWAQA